MAWVAVTTSHFISYKYICAWGMLYTGIITFPPKVIFRTLPNSSSAISFNYWLAVLNWRNIKIHCTYIIRPASGAGIRGKIRVFFLYIPTALNETNLCRLTIHHRICEYTNHVDIFITKNASSLCLHPFSTFSNVNDILTQFVTKWIQFVVFSLVFVDLHMANVCE